MAFEDSPEGCRVALQQDSYVGLWEVVPDPEVEFVWAARQVGGEVFEVLLDLSDELDPCEECEFVDFDAIVRRSADGSDFVTV